MYYARVQAEEAIVQSSVAIAEYQATHIAIYLTLLFAYIVAIYVAGARLTRLQLVVVTVLFVAVAAYEVMIIAAVAIGSGKATAKLAEFTGNLVQQAPGSETMWPYAILWSAGIVAALVFTWSVRRDKPD